MDVSKQLKVVYVLLAVLCVGQAYSLYENKFPTLVADEKHFSLNNQPVIATSTLSDVKIGNNPVADSVIGIVTQVNNGVFQVKEQSGNVVDTVSVNTSTVIEIGGALKDNVTIQAELAAYNAKVQELLKDPVANKAALAAMKLPSPQVLTPATISDIQVGDTVVVTAPNKGPNNNYMATIVVKMGPSAPAIKP